MINLLCGLVGMAIPTFFIGGLAFSIYENTDSIAFPIIVAIVLLMAYISLVDEIRSNKL
ncbi:hypothetical protein [Sedimenticola sp.]|uniref:hypothetical protein n=1 Tax=Sedimenticola sp. TaxID=1940285 RepID=UPI003D14C030